MNPINRKCPIPSRNTISFFFYFTIILIGLLSINGIRATTEPGEDDNILDIFVGNEEISGTIIESFPDQDNDTVRIAIETLVSSYTKMITIHVNREVAYSIYCGYRDGIPHGDGIVYNTVSFKVDPTRQTMLFSFWKAKDFELLERITDRNYPVSKLQGHTVIISWPNKNDPNRFIKKGSRLTPDQLEVNPF